MHQTTHMWTRYTQGHNPSVGGMYITSRLHACACHRRVLVTSLWRLPAFQCRQVHCSECSVGTTVMAQMLRLPSR